MNLPDYIGRYINVRHRALLYEVYVRGQHIGCIRRFTESQQVGTEVDFEDLDNSTQNTILNAVFPNDTESET